MGRVLISTNSWSRVLLKKPFKNSATEYFPALYGTRIFITVFTTARRLSVSCARFYHSVSSHPISLKIHFNITLPSRPSSSKLFIFFRFSYHNSAWFSPLPHAYHITCPSHPPVFHQLNAIAWEGQILQPLFIQLSFYFLPLNPYPANVDKMASSYQC